VLVRHQAGSTTLSVTATRRGSTVMPHYTLLCSVGDIKSPPRLTQFTGRLCKKTAQAVGDAEAVKSSVLRCLSSGNPVVTGLAIFSGRRPQFARKPAERVRSHRVMRYNRRFDAAAFLAFKCPVVETGRCRFKLRQQHPILLALRAAGPFDPGYLRRGYRLKFGHDASLSFVCVAGPAMTRIAGGRRPNRTMASPASSAVVKTAHI